MVLALLMFVGASSFSKVTFQTMPRGDHSSYLYLCFSEPFKALSGSWDKRSGFCPIARFLLCVPSLHLFPCPGRTDSPSFPGKLNLAAFVVENVCKAQFLPEASQPLLEDNWGPDFPRWGNCPCGMEVQPSGWSQHHFGHPRLLAISAARMLRT